jgi:phospholipid/cholesterol/gamma-HCH transport system ATP-binding protein
MESAMDTPQGTPAIELRDLRKQFGDQVVLNGITLRVDAGETVAVLGRSGTGKSVLLKLLVGLQKPDSGVIRIRGQEIAALAEPALNAVRAGIGFLFQEAALYDSLDVGDNVAFPLRHRPVNGDRGAGDPPDVAQRVTELLSFVGLEDARAKMPAALSGGMKKRVGLARALALQPDILLFDEPTSALDPITASEIEALILRLRKEQHVASVVVTHDLRSARRIGDRLAFIHKGVFVFDGPPDALKESKHPFVTQFLQEAS